MFRFKEIFLNGQTFFNMILSNWFKRARHINTETNEIEIGSQLSSGKYFTFLYFMSVIHPKRRI